MNENENLDLMNVEEAAAYLKFSIIIWVTKRQSER